MASTTEGSVEVKTGYIPRKLQKVFHQLLKRFNVLVCHRRFGKTVFSINEMIDRAVRNNLRNPQYAYVAPTYKQAKKIAWQYFKDYTRNIPGVMANKSELSIYIERSWRVNPITGKTDPDTISLMLIGADDPDSLRGIYLDGAVMDEYAQCDPIIWGQIIRPALADRKKEAREVGLDKDPGYKDPWVIFIGTPKGQNHFHKRYLKAQAAEGFCAEFEATYDPEVEKVKWDTFEIENGILAGVSIKEINRILATMAEAKVEQYNLWRKYKASNNWYTALYKASETGILDADEIDEMVEDLDEEEVEQELECSFTAAIKGSYFGHHINNAKADGRIGHIPYNPSYAVDTFWDIGVGDKTVIWFRQKIGGFYYYIDYHEMNGEGLEYYVRFLQAKAGRLGSQVELKKGVIITGREFKYGRHLWPHDGKAKEFGTGETRQERAWRKYNLRVDIIKRVAVDDKIDAGRERIKVSFFDSAHCERGIECLYNYQKEYDSKRAMFLEKPNHDWSSHGADGFCYSALDNKDSVLENLGRRGKLLPMGNAQGTYDELGQGGL